MDDATPNPDPHPLRPHICPRCEYSLQAHPPMGICPECGYEYDDKTVFLYGRALAYKEGLWNRHPRSWVSLLMDVIGLLFLIWLLASTLICALPLLVLLLVMLVSELWLRFADHESRLVQVRLVPAGFRQVNRGFGAIPFHRSFQKAPIPWHNAQRVRLSMYQHDRMHLLIVSPWWRLGEYIHADLHCTPAQAAELQKRIEQWWQRPVTFAA